MFAAIPLDMLTTATEQSTFVDTAIQTTSGDRRAPGVIAPDRGTWAIGIWQGIVSDVMVLLPLIVNTLEARFSWQDPQPFIFLFEALSLRRYLPSPASS